MNYSFLLPYFHSTIPYAMILARLTTKTTKRAPAC